MPEPPDTDALSDAEWGHGCRAGHRNPAPRRQRGLRGEAALGRAKGGARLHAVRQPGGAAGTPAAPRGSCRSRLRPARRQPTLLIRFHRRARRASCRAEISARRDAAGVPLPAQTTSRSSTPGSPAPWSPRATWTTPARSPRPRATGAWRCSIPCSTATTSRTAAPRDCCAVPATCSSGSLTASRSPDR